MKPETAAATHVPLPNVRVLPRHPDSRVRIFASGHTRRSWFG